MAEQSATSELERFATAIEVAGMQVHKASIYLDERQDGEPVTRITLLVNDPGGGEGTWPLEAVSELKRNLARKAAELGLPSASVTLVPDSEANLVESFAR